MSPFATSPLLRLPFATSHPSKIGVFECFYGANHIIGVKSADHAFLFARLQADDEGGQTQILTLMGAEGWESFSDGKVRVFRQATLRKRLPTLSFSSCVRGGLEEAGNEAAPVGTARFQSLAQHRADDSRTDAKPETAVPAGRQVGKFSASAASEFIPLALRRNQLHAASHR